VTFGIESISNSIQINSLKPKQILPTVTPKPKAMLIKIGEIMTKLKTLYCPDFFLLIQIGNITVYNDFTYSQCEIQAVFAG
jgi:hypothetical protein